ncbi:hypothetical protein Tco_1118529 [Tanacetum coccineum]
MAGMGCALHHEGTSADAVRSSEVLGSLAFCHLPRPGRLGVSGVVVKTFNPKSWSRNSKRFLVKLCVDICQLIDLSAGHSCSSRAMALLLSQYRGILIEQKAVILTRGIANDVIKRNRVLLQRVNWGMMVSWSIKTTVAEGTGSFSRFDSKYVMNIGWNKISRSLSVGGMYVVAGTGDGASPELSCPGVIQYQSHCLSFLNYHQIQHLHEIEFHEPSLWMCIIRMYSSSRSDFAACTSVALPFPLTSTTGSFLVVYGLQFTICNSIVLINHPYEVQEPVETYLHQQFYKELFSFVNVMSRFYQLEVTSNCFDPLARVELLTPVEGIT